MRRKSKTRVSLRKLTAVCCAAALVVSSTGALVANARAGSQSPFGDGTPINEEYNEHLSLQPTSLAFQMKTVLEWTPEYDTDAQYNRATIPLADRFTGPLVSDLKNPDAKLTIASMANQNHDNTPSQGSDQFNSFAFDYWQYLDSYIYWAGSGSTEGIVLLPTPDMTDSAHRNGVPMLGMFAFPWEDGGSGQKELHTMVQKNPDGTYPVADKLVEMAKYYGFDGYFFNAEGFGYSSDVAELINLMKYVHKKYPDFIFNWYNCIGGPGVYEGTPSKFIAKDADGLYAVDEMFCNYGAEYSVDTTINTMINNGRNPYDAFIGYEMQKGGDVDTQLSDHLLMGADNRIKTSIGLFIPNSTQYKAKDPADFHVKERDLYVGFSGDPTVWPGDPSDPAAPKWIGLSRFFAEKSVVDEAPFTTTFNTGHGKQWFVDGALSREKEWNNRSMSDVLPTFTWLVESEGSKLVPNYDFDDAYNGGNSIKYVGNLDAGKENTSLLYSTKVDVAGNTKVKLTYKQNSDQKVQLGVYYGDSYEDQNVTYYDLSSSAAGNGWTTGTADLSADAGKVAVGLSIRVESADGVQDYALNLGQLSIVNEDSVKLPAPEKVYVDEMDYILDTVDTDVKAEVRLKWTPVEGASYYEVYYEKSEGVDKIISAIPNTAYYINSLSAVEGKDYAAVKVVPVAADGTKGQAQVLNIQWDPEMQGDGIYVPRIQEEEISANVALNRPVSGSPFDQSGEEFRMAVDGSTISKWCAPGARSGYLDVTLDTPTTIKRWRVEHAEAGGEDPKSNNKNFGLQYQDESGAWQSADYVSNNTNPVTDRVLSTPVTAQKFRLKIDSADSGAIWGAIRVYEFQLFEKSGQTQTNPHPARLAKAVNNAGANDVITFNNVQKYQEIAIYRSPSDSEPIARQKAPDYGTTLTFDGLDLGADAGRIYYTTTDYRIAAAESGYMSIPYMAESNTEKAAQSMNITFAPYSEMDSTNYRFGDSQVYASVRVNDLKPGDVVYAYKNADDAIYTKKSLPVAEGESSAVINNLLMDDINGGITLEIGHDGMHNSDKYTVRTHDLLKAQMEKAKSITKADYPVGFAALQKAIAAAESAYANDNAGFAETVAAQAGLNEALANVKATTEVLQSIVDYAEKIKAEGALDNTVEVVVNGFNAALDEAKALIADPASTQTQLNDSAVKLLGYIAKVDWKQGDKTALQVAVDVAASINENIDLYLDTDAFVQAYATAQEVLNSGNAMQDDVDAAFSALVEAMSNLKMEPNKDILNDMINKANSIDVNGYTADSVKTFNAALEAAKAVAANGKATQDDIDNAVANLQAAQAGLTKTPAVDVPVINTPNDDPIQNTGDGSAPTKTGDAGSFALMALTALAGAAVLLSKKRK